MNKKSWVQERKNELLCTAVGAGSGLTAGVVIGGVGIVAMGTGFGMPAGLGLMFVGGMIGNKVGSERDRHLNNQESDRG